MQLRKKLLFAQFLVLALLAAWNAIGVYEDAYARFFIWDIVAHLLGGAWAGLGVAWLLAHFRHRASIVHCVIGVFIIGVVWEFYELYFGIGGSDFMTYWFDTSKDIVADIIGAFAVGYIWIRPGKKTGRM